MLPVINIMRPECPARIDADGTGLIVGRACSSETGGSQCLITKSIRQIWPIPLSQIEANSFRLIWSGRGAVSVQPACFQSPDIQPLCKTAAPGVCRRSSHLISGNTRTTVRHAIGKVKRLQKPDSRTSFIEVLTAALTAEQKRTQPPTIRIP